jgi:hypothetical protein
MMVDCSLELEWVSKGNKFLTNDEKGDVFVFELEDVFDQEWYVPLVDSVLSGALSA